MRKHLLSLVGILMAISGFSQEDVEPSYTECRIIVKTDSIPTKFIQTEFSEQGSWVLIGVVANGDTLPARVLPRRDDSSDKQLIELPTPIRATNIELLILKPKIQGVWTVKFKASKDVAFRSATMVEEEENPR